MKKENWDKRIADIRGWIEDQDTSDNMNAILLSIELGDSANSDALRSTYWNAIRSIGGTMLNFPTKYMPKKRRQVEINFDYVASKPRDGGLRSRFRSELRGVNSRIRDTGRVIYNEKNPTLENLRVECSVCDDIHGESQEKRIRKICSTYGLREENIHILYKDCSPKPSRSRYEKIGKSGAYHGGNRWN
jgi:hypothetical protein